MEVDVLPLNSLLYLDVGYRNVSAIGTPLDSTCFNTSKSLKLHICMSTAKDWNAKSGERCSAIDACGCLRICMVFILSTDRGEM